MLPYKGKVVYLGPDEPMQGLMHGTHYFIEARQMKSGRVRVNIEGMSYIMPKSHLTYSRDEYDMAFLAVKEKRGKNGRV